MKLTLHHLNNSRSIRILWLLEEAGLDYQLVRYQRDLVTHLAPPSLRAIHALGKSPVIEVDGKVISESGAIVEYLIHNYAPHLAPAQNTLDYIDYLQWIHFAESSAMLPVLLKIFGDFEKKTGTQLNFLESYSDNEFEKVFRFLDTTLMSRDYICGDKLSGADIMLGFAVSTALEQLNVENSFPNLSRYSMRLKYLASWQRAQLIEDNGKQE